MTDQELNSNSYKLTSEKLVALALSGMGFWFALSKVSRGYGAVGDYFDAFKLALCIAAAILGFRAFTKGILWPAASCIVVAIIYNPFLKLDLDSDSWRAVNFATGIAFLWVLWQFQKISKVMNPQRIEKMRLAEARAEAINEAISSGALDEDEYNKMIRKLKGE